MAKTNFLEYQIQLPFRARRHRDYKEAQRRTHEWAHRFRLLQDENLRRRFKSLGYGRLMAYACPTAALEDLMLIVDWNTLFFLFDDLQDCAVLNDRTDGYHQLQEAARRTIGSRGRKAQSACQLTLALADLCQRTFSRMSEAAARRFQENLEKWLAGHLQENRYRLAGTVPDVETYIKMRRDACTVLPTLDLIEVAERAEVPEKIYRSNSYQTLASGIADIMCFINDIHSLHVEETACDPINLVIVLQCHEGLGRLAAVEAVVARVASRVEDYLAAASVLPELMAAAAVPLDMQAAILRCLGDQGSWAAGMERWDRTDTTRFSDDGIRVLSELPLYASSSLDAGDT